MRIGTLVKTPVNGIGMIIEKKIWCVGNYDGTVAYYVLYTDGHKHWWTAGNLEIICE